MKKMLLFIKKNYFIVLFLSFVFFMSANYVCGMALKVMNGFSEDNEKTKIEYIEGFSDIKAEAEAFSNKTASNSKASAIDKIKSKWYTVTNSISSQDDIFVLHGTFLNINAAFCRSIGIDYIPGTTFIKTSEDSLTYLVDEQDVFNDKANCDVRLNYLNSFAKILKSEGIDVIYVNVPDKSYALLNEIPIGLRPDTLFNINDYVAQELKKYNIPCVDILIKESVGSSELFYKTDHHWKTEYGVYSAGIIAEYLNSAYNYNIDTSVYKKENYSSVKYEDALLGSIGTNSTGAFVDAEDLEILYPKNDGNYSFSIPSKNIALEGGFDIFINKEKLDNKSDWPFNAYAVYIYANSAYVRIENKEINDDHKILIIKDSFANIIVPHLAQTVGTVDVIDIRESQADYFSDSVIELIRENQYDNVIFIASKPFSMNLLFVK